MEQTEQWYKWIQRTSAYDIWITNGNTGTQQDFLNSLQGASGTNGTNGSNGINGVNGSNGQSAYDIWIANGNTGTQQDFEFSSRTQGPVGQEDLVLQKLSISGSTISLSNGGGSVSINDATVILQMKLNSHQQQIQEIYFNTMDSWVAASSGSSSSSAGTVMYIYDGQTCPTGWNTQQINAPIFGTSSVDACWTDTPCIVMYIYNNQTCPTGWTHQNISAPILTSGTIAVDACFKCY